MDIERLKRLNSLAGELKCQGIAANYEDAAYLATAIAGREPEQCLSGMHMSDDQTTMVQEIISNNPIQEQPEQYSHEVLEQQTQQPVHQGITKEEVENILQLFANQIAKEITLLQNKVQNAEARVAELNQTFQTQKQQVQQKLPESAVKERTVDPVPQKKEITHEDVSVEKMFYFGKK